ncbi:MAG: Putative competence protein comEA [Microgenomates bacterium 39_7]|nr:MAG: Putative competence protein comEA [Microgenomates bacterium 39_7]
MSLSSELSKSSKTSKKWRTLAALVFFILGVASVVWGTHNLLIQTQVPSCVNSVDELSIGELEDDGAEDGELEEDKQKSDEQAPENLIKTKNTFSGLGSIQVEISGAVENPGLYWLSYESRLGDLIKLSGGFTKDADIRKVNQQLNLAQKLKDEQKIKIPYKQEVEMEEWLALYCQSITAAQENKQTPTSATAEISEIGQTIESDSPTEISEQSCISINYASSAQLQTLTGVGEKTAQLIIESRPYFKISELLEVKGIGDATLEKLEPFICL